MSNGKAGAPNPGHRHATTDETTVPHWLGWSPEKLARFREYQAGLKRRAEAARRLPPTAGRMSWEGLAAYDPWLAA